MFTNRLTGYISQLFFDGMSAPQAYSVDQGQSAYPPGAPAASYPPTAGYPPPQDQQFQEKTAFDQQGVGYPPQQPPVYPQQTAGYPQAAPPPGYYDQQQATSATTVSYALVFSACTTLLCQFNSHSFRWGFSHKAQLGVINIVAAYYYSNYSTTLIY